MKGLSFVALALALAAQPSVLAGQSVPPDFPLDRSAIEFGSAVAIGDGDVIVGEPMNRTEGVVYVYRADASGQWSEVQQLRASDHEPGDRFGRALALAGDRLLIGSTSQGSGRGAAYVFERDPGGVWREAAILTAADGAPGDALGRAVALLGEWAFAGAAGDDDGHGAVYVFRRAASGRWTEAGKLEPGVAGRTFFGLSLAAADGRLAVGAPLLGGGVVFVFRHEAGTDRWRHEAQLAPAGLPEDTRFGAQVALADGRLLASAPTVNRNQGVVHAFRHGANGWTAGEAVSSPDSARFQQFGAALAVHRDRAWIGAPMAGRFQGVVHAYRWADTAWTFSASVEGLEVERGDGFGGAVALTAGRAVVGMSGDDFGEGTAIVFEETGGGWEAVAKIFSEGAGLAAITGDSVPCMDDRAAIFGCTNVDILSFLPREQLEAPRGARLNDVWGWTDSAAGRRYAIVGIMSHAAFVDVTDPVNPVYLGKLPRTGGSPPSTWRDMKVYRNHAFIVADGAGEHGMQVFDLTRLRHVTNPPVTFTPDTTYHEVASVHNIVINTETGFAFAVGSGDGGTTCGGGLHIIDIREPTRPRFAGCFAHEGTGRRQTGYSHDAQCVIYQGPDAQHRGREICFAANETAISIADVTDKERPVALSQAAYPNVAYAHQGWLSGDHAWFYQNDELDEVNGLVPNTRTLVWDVRDLDDPVLAKEFFHETQSTDHNLYVDGRYMYQTNNTAGLRILDVSDPVNPVLVGYFDPVPWGEDAPGFDGTWSSYPYFGDGLVLVSSRREGLFVIRHRPVTPVP